ncbi:hypothetical protein LCGC14_0962230 [marine sediment metagenome]|uniref:Uncharacterized protein n=1 Tax=marine sediment metagenome TaxID=412755 RepID=A0A0F9NE72_9ZZZZ
MDKWFENKNDKYRTRKEMEIQPIKRKKDKVRVGSKWWHWAILLSVLGFFIFILIKLR